jgi:predicted glycosyltransferase
MIRVVLYSHDTMGLGHVRRNLLIAQGIIDSGWQANVLLISGIHTTNALKMPAGVDCLTLPALYKQADGQYRSRGLNVSLKELISLRAATIKATLTAYQPDVLIVDNVPRGAMRELEPSLEYLRCTNKTHCVLGLRDVLDDPEVVRREWQQAQNEDAIRRYYDAIWVYGDPAVCDPALDYHFPPEIGAKVRYTGYFDQCQRLESQAAVDALAALDLPPGQLALCLVGGGQDGARLANAFAQADLPPGFSGVILCGPFMPQRAQEQLHQLAARQSRLRVFEFLPEPGLLLGLAERIIAMGGYNTTCEVLSFEKTALIVPRVHPRREQLIRAERLRDLGLIDLLHPDSLSPEVLSRWLARDVHPPQRVREQVDMNALKHLPGLLAEALVSSRSASHTRPTVRRISRMHQAY